jgi:anthranilate phosphoribosyltransferase
MGTSNSGWHPSGLAQLLERRDLPEAMMAAVVRDLTSGNFDDAEAAALLIALRMKGESATEIAAAVQVLREAMARLSPPIRPVLDTCGTGGDGSGTFNISTATALVVAATGVPVVKHGNRSVSSRSGSADVLSALGVAIESGPAWSQRTLETLGFAFCFAPHFHPALAKVAAIRRKLGVRTLFNLLGPLLNPGGAEHQLLGVGRLELLDPMAGAVARLGTSCAILVHGSDGLDEVTLSGPTHVRIVRGSSVESVVWNAENFGLSAVACTELFAEGPAESAEYIRRVLRGDDGPARKVVLANAAAALLAAERVKRLQDGVALATEAIDSGRAQAVLAGLVSSTAAPK